MVGGTSGASEASAAPREVTILDGPLGTELWRRGVATPLPGWSAHALLDAPEVVRAIHADYAAAGARVHTANTFRARERTFPRTWRELVARALQLAREGLPAGARVAGSLAPLEDCYRPELSPADPRPEHRAMARALADAGADLILVETFPHPGEALVALEEALATGKESWLALSAGPRGDLMSPDTLRRTAARAVELGAGAVLANCIAASRMLPFVEALAGLGVPFGAYANAGAPEERCGWAAEREAPELYLAHARRWVACGASLVGSCCGTGVAHVAALARAFGPR